MNDLMKKENLDNAFKFKEPVKKGINESNKISEKEKKIINFAFRS